MIYIYLLGSKKNYFLIWLGFVSQILTSQEYIEIAKISYGTIFNAGFTDTDASTDISTLDLGLTYPIKLNDKVAILSGFDYGQYGFELFPDTEKISLRYLRMKAGINIKHSDRWSGTYIVLPKIASQNLEITNDSFFFGGLILLKYQKNDHFQYRFGAYASTEGFGVLTTPVLGLYYLSSNREWEATLNLPINGDINYRFNNSIAIGLGFQAPVRSYRLRETNSQPQFYVQSNRIELGVYAEHSFMDKSLLVRIQGGYSAISYEAFEKDDTLPIRLSAFEFGDDRNLLNPEMTGGVFAKIGVTYRFHLAK